MHYKPLKLEDIKIKVLIADPSEMVTMSLANILPENYKIFKTNNSGNVLQLLKKKYPQIIIISLKMHKISGLEILNKIKAEKPEIIGILLTEYADEKIIEYHNINKPINIENFKKVVNSAALEYLANKNQKMLLKKIKKQNFELHRQNKDLADLNKRKTEFIRNVAHQFATPLTAMLTSSELILKNEKKKNKTLNLLASNIYANALQLSQIIDNIIAIAKIETGEFRIFSKEIRFLEIVRDVKQYTEVYFNPKNIRLDIQIEPGCERINIDKKVFNLFFINIFSHIAVQLEKAASIIWYIKKEDNNLITCISSKASLRLPKVLNKIKKNLDSFLEKNISQQDLSSSMIAFYTLTKFLKAEIKMRANRKSGTYFEITFPLP